MRGLSIAALLASCVPPAVPAASSRSAAAPTTAIAPASAPVPTPRDCIIAGDDEAPVTVEGTLRQGESRGHLVLRLLEPRCAVGVARASVLTEVMLVSEGFDLRPLVGARIRAVGRALGDASVPEGPAVIIVARSVERLAAKDAP